MEKDQDTPFAREPWQRLLQERADAPPETTDARIRAAARKAAAPRAARWWLPASLAASVLVAALIVQSQVGREVKPPVVTESDLPAPAVTDEGAGAAPAHAADSTTTAKRRVTAAPEAAEAEFTPPPAPRVGGPERENKAASEIERPPADEPASTPATGIVAHDVPAREKPADVSFMQAGDGMRTPEAWYADIEALRKAGRIADADAELARFEAAFPDWLKQHSRPKP